MEHVLHPRHGGQALGARESLCVLDWAGGPAVRDLVHGSVVRRAEAARLLGHRESGGMVFEPLVDGGAAGRRADECWSVVHWHVAADGDVVPRGATRHPGGDAGRPANGIAFPVGAHR